MFFRKKKKTDISETVSNAIFTECGNIGQETETDEKDESFKRELKLAYINPPVIISAGVALTSALVALVAIISKDFAEGYSRTVGRFLRMVLAKISGILPFSLAETLLFVGFLFLLYSLIRMIYEAIRKVDYERRYEIRFNKILISAMLAALSLYNFSFSACNRRVPLEENLGYERGMLTSEQLYECMIKVQDELHLCLEEGDIRYTPGGSTVSPYSFDELNEKLNDIYAQASVKYPFIDGFRSKVKPVALSEPLTYTGIAGIYTAYTGEVNVNTNYPDYVSTFSMGHEMAHQRGMAREDEANFAAFLVMYESDDPYLRYCALTELFIYLSDALYDEDEALFSKAIAQCDKRIIYEMLGYSYFVQPYSDSVASKVTGAVNDVSIKLRGDPDGEKSYNMMIELAAVYFGIE